jgi:hypothetical protein
MRYLADRRNSDYIGRNRRDKNRRWPEQKLDPSKARQKGIQ